MKNAVEVFACDVISHSQAGIRMPKPNKTCAGCGFRGDDWIRIRKRQWCAACVAGASALVKCEGCGFKQSLPVELSKRWCVGCVSAGRQESAQNKTAREKAARKQCEDCGLKVPNFGLESERKVRWCGPCAKAHGGVNYRASTANSTTARTAQRKRAVGRASTAGATKRGRGQNSYSEKGRTEA